MNHREPSLDKTYALLNAKLDQWEAAINESRRQLKWTMVNFAIGLCCIGVAFFTRQLWLVWYAILSMNALPWLGGPVCASRVDKARDDFYQTQARLISEDPKNGDDPFGEED